MIGVDFKTVEPRMSRDFLINFENIELLEKSLKIFQEINHLNNEKIFEIDCRNKSIFVSLIFNKEIKNFHELIIKKIIL